MTKRQEIMLLMIGVFLAFLLLGGIAWLAIGDNPVVNQYIVDGIAYECVHYDNGDMECEQVGDPDVGGGRITP